MPKPILTIFNQHTPECGVPPSIDNESFESYIGYFENPYGEQWIFTFDPKTREAYLRGGELGWDAVHRVQDGVVEGLILNKAEIAWLRACWSAANPGWAE
jgi:hypothetical protein